MSPHNTYHTVLPRRHVFDGFGNRLHQSGDRGQSLRLICHEAGMQRCSHPHRIAPQLGIFPGWRAPYSG